MGRGIVKLKPGVDTAETPVLNEAEFTHTNLIRFMQSREGLGLVQKLGGWVAYFNSAMTTPVRALKGWSDLNAINHLAVGCEGGLYVITNNVIQDITPQIKLTDFTPNFSTTSGSNVVTIVDAGITTTVYDLVEFATPVSVGGLILQGPYQIQTAASTTYSIYAAANATSTVANGGAVPTFSTTSGSAKIVVSLPSNTYNIGDTFYVAVSTTVGGVTLFGAYQILFTPLNDGTLSAGQFAFYATNTATSTAGPISENSGKVKATYYVAIGPQVTSTGYGVGGYGVGGFGTGTAQPSVPGTPITATDWSLENYGENLIACPTGGPIYGWTPANPTLQTAQIVSTNAPLINDGIFVAMPQRQIVAWGSSFNLVQDPLLIRWSDNEDATVWDGQAINQAGSYRIPTGSKIMTCIQAAQQGIIWTDVDVWAMQYIGPPLVYGFNKISSNCGAISRKCVGQLNNAVYWMSQNQFFVLAGSGPQTLPCPIWDNIFQNLRSGNDSNGTPYSQRVRCAVNSYFNEITWYFPRANVYPNDVTLGSSYTITSVGTTNFTLMGAANNNVGTTFTATAYGTGTGMLTSNDNDSYVKFNAQLNTWDYGNLGRTAWIDQSVLGSPIGSGADKFIYRHEVGNDAAVGTTIQPMMSLAKTGWFEVGEADNMIFIDQIWPDMKWGTYENNNNATVYLTFYGTNYPGNDPVIYGPYAMTQATEYITVRLRHRLIAMELTSNDIGTFWRIGGIRYRFAPDGKY